MPKKLIITGKPAHEYILVPAAWLERLVALAEEKDTTSQHLKGYIASADPIVQNGKRIDEATYYSLM